MRLQYSAAQLRLMAEKLRLDMVDSLHEAGSGHPGGSLSIAEIMSVLYCHEMNLDPSNPQWAERDRFVLSKGHAAPAYYAALPREAFSMWRFSRRCARSTASCRAIPTAKRSPALIFPPGPSVRGSRSPAAWPAPPRRRADVYKRQLPWWQNIHRNGSYRAVSAYSHAGTSHKAPADRASARHGSSRRRSLKR